MPDAGEWQTANKAPSGAAQRQLGIGQGRSRVGDDFEYLLVHLHESTEMSY